MDATTPTYESQAGAPSSGTEGGFGIDAFTLDDRLRLFHFAAAEKRREYLWLLRAFDRARAEYQVLLHASDAGALLGRMAAEHPDMAAAGAVGEVQPLLDALADWQVLDRSYDGTRAANLAEYRNRHHVYQFTQAGYRAYRAVEEVLGASLEDAQLSRLVFPDILLADLRALAEAAGAGDGEEVYRKLSRLDTALADMAQRAARFYGHAGGRERLVALQAVTGPVLDGDTGVVGCDSLRHGDGVSVLRPVKPPSTVSVGRLCRTCPVGNASTSGPSSRSMRRGPAVGQKTHALRSTYSVLCDRALLRQQFPPAVYIPHAQRAAQYDGQPAAVPV
jgi:hypothetical protein